MSRISITESFIDDYIKKVVDRYNKYQDPHAAILAIAKDNSTHKLSIIEPWQIVSEQFRLQHSIYSTNIADYLGQPTEYIKMKVIDYLQNEYPELFSQSIVNHQIRMIVICNWNFTLVYAGSSRTSSSVQKEMNEVSRQYPHIHAKLIEVYGDVVKFKLSGDNETLMKMWLQSANVDQQTATIVKY